MVLVFAVMCVRGSMDRAVGARSRRERKAGKERCWKISIGSRVNVGLRPAGEHLDGNLELFRENNILFIYTLHHFLDASHSIVAIIIGGSQSEAEREQDYIGREQVESYSLYSMVCLIHLGEIARVYINNISMGRIVSCCLHIAAAYLHSQSCCLPR